MSIAGEPQLSFLWILIPISGEQVWNPRLLLLRVSTQSHASLASASVSYDTGGSDAFGGP